MPKEEKEEEDKPCVICIDEPTLTQLTKKLEENLLELQKGIRELKRHVISASGRKRYRKTDE